MTKLKPHPLDNTVSEYLQALEENSWRWRLEGGDGYHTIAIIQTDEGEYEEAHDKRGIGLCSPLFDLCKRVGLVEQVPDRSTS